ncbi:hypothetical protein N9K16_00960, partial [Alphaproteobacteria bacterium]|nr:hypothetical protein [Alphaproteobacteria bacterium]
WENTIEAVGAKRAVLIHWDDDQESMYVEKGSNFKIAKHGGFNRTLEDFDRLASKRGVEIKFPPPAEPFDPLLGLK